MYSWAAAARPETSCTCRCDLSHALATASRIAADEVRILVGFSAEATPNSSLEVSPNMHICTVVSRTPARDLNRRSRGSFHDEALRGCSKTKCRPPSSCNSAILTATFTIRTARIQSRRGTPWRHRFQRLQNLVHGGLSTTSCGLSRRTRANAFSASAGFAKSQWRLVIPSSQVMSKDQPARKPRSRALAATRGGENASATSYLPRDWGK